MDLITLFFKITLCIYFWLCWVGLCCCAGLFSSCGKQGLLSSFGMRASHCKGFSCWRRRLWQYSSLENPHGQRSLAGYRPWNSKESDMTEWLRTLLLKRTGSRAQTSVVEPQGFCSCGSRSLEKTLSFLVVSNSRTCWFHKQNASTKKKRHQNSGYKKWRASFLNINWPLHYPINRYKYEEHNHGKKSFIEINL